MKNMVLVNSPQNILKYLEKINNTVIIMPILNIAGLFISNPNKIVIIAITNNKALKTIVLAKTNSGLIRKNRVDKIIKIETANSYFEDFEVKKPFIKFKIIKPANKTISAILTKKYAWWPTFAYSSKMKLTEIIFMRVKIVMYPNILKNKVKSLTESMFW
jgi:hypothetical protein